MLHIGAKKIVDVVLFGGENKAQLSNEGIFLASFSEVYVDALIVKVDRYKKKIHRQKRLRLPITSL